MLKFKTGAAMLALAAIFSFSGCSKIDNAAYRSLSEAVEQTVTQSGGRLQITNQSTGVQDMNLCFSYCYEDDGVMQYCVEQTDPTGRRIFLEHHDGNVMQRWLLGHGSNIYDETDSEYLRYTREKPYKYVALLEELPSKDAILELTVSQIEGGTEYLLQLDPQKVKGTTEPEEILQSRMLRYLVSDGGMLKEYEENSSYLCSDETENHYRLIVLISQLGEIDTITLPQID